MPEFEGAICEEYFSSIIRSKLIGQSIAFVAVGINVILKFTVMFLVKFIGEETLSQQKATVTRGVFLGQFANTGFIILMVNANLSEHFPQSITTHFRGPFYDYVPMWYIDVGLKVTVVLIVQLILPFIACTITHTVPCIKRSIDNGCTGNPYKTKSTTISKYRYMNSGAEYMIHFKYSDALNVTFVSLMYCLSMPILLITAAITLRLQLTSEMISIAWVARLPPAMDNSLNNNALMMITFAPIFMLMNGFWMVDSKIIFSNFWDYKMRVNEQMHSGHYFEGFQVNHATPLLLFVMIAIVSKCVLLLIPEYWQRYFDLVDDSQLISVDEDLPNFFEVIPIRKAEEIIAEYKNIKERYGIEIEDSEVIRKLEKTKWPEKQLQGAPWYNILTNNDYIDKFNYINAMDKDRTAYIKDINKDKNVQSDLVVLLLQLSTIPDEIIH